MSRYYILIIILYATMHLNEEKHTPYINIDKASNRVEVKG
jgi:desulfoferrodoxin (superoxide reductase-like protein)